MSSAWAQRDHLQRLHATGLQTRRGKAARAREGGRQQSSFRTLLGGFYKETTKVM